MTVFTLLLITIHPQKIRNFLSHHESAQIIICDGSLHGLEKIPECANVKYFHRPTLSYFERVNFGLNFVNTKYVLLAGDDEFFNLENINFLLSDNDNTLVMGKTLLHNGFFKNSFIDQYTKLYYGIRYIANDDNANVEVLKSFLIEGNVYWYSAVLTDVMKSYCKNYSLDDEMADFELSLPFEILNIKGGTVATYDYIWLKRHKYDRNIKISTLNPSIVKSHLLPIIRMTHIAKLINYINERPTRFFTINLLIGVLKFRICSLLYKLGLIRIDYK